MKISLLKEYIRHTITEARALRQHLSPEEQAEYKKNNDVFEKLKELSKNSNLFIHFAKVDKLGINPRSEYNDTPIGIYAYPLTTELLAQADSDEGLPFGGTFPHIHVFSPTRPDRILDLQAYTDDQLDKDLETLNIPVKITNAARMDVRKGPGEILWKSLEEYNSHENDVYAGKFNAINPDKPIVLNPGPRNWRRQLVSLGYDGVVDNGQGIIHINEPAQAVFFGVNLLTPVFSGLNPLPKMDRARDFERAKTEKNRYRRLRKSQNREK